MISHSLFYKAKMALIKFKIQYLKEIQIYLTF